MQLLPDPDQLRRRLREVLKVALNARDKIAVAALRSALSAIDNAEAVDRSHAPAPGGGTIGDVRLGVGAGEVARRNLSTQDVIEVIRAEVLDRTIAAAEYERLGRADEASRLRAEATTLLSFLETALTEP
jgi:uncharacterized protein YqeY